MIGKAGIAALIPHAGAMCLLDSVLNWNAAEIACLATSHCDPGNPLARDGRLAAICGIEYAAQAMAVHGGLLAGSGPPPGAGYLASLREVTCLTGRLDDLKGPLLVTAAVLFGETSRVIYRFALRHGDTTLIQGCATVVLTA